MTPEQEQKRKRVTWGITGSGDRLNEIIEVTPLGNEKFNPNDAVLLDTPGILFPLNWS